MPESGSQAQRGPGWLTRYWLTLTRTLPSYKKSTSTSYRWSTLMDTNIRGQMIACGGKHEALMQEVPAWDVTLIEISTSNGVSYGFCKCILSYFDTFIIAGESTSSDPCSDIYYGSAPFSEPETQAIDRFVREAEAAGVQFYAYITMHSYANVILNVLEKIGKFPIWSKCSSFLVVAYSMGLHSRCLSSRFPSPGKLHQFFGKICAELNGKLFVFSWVWDKPL